MDKKLKNKLFKVAVDYLFQEKKVGSQKELAEKIGITEQSLSRVMNGGRTVSDKTLRLMNEAFGGIFNMAYFRGEDPHCMLMEDLAYFKQHPEKRFVFVKSKDNPQPEPAQSSIKEPETAPIDKQQDALTYAAIQVGKMMADLSNSIASVREFQKKLEEREAQLEHMTATLTDRIAQLDKLTATLARQDQYRIPDLELLDMAAEPLKKHAE